MAELRDVSDASSAAEVLASGIPLRVDPWGDHCPACRRISPILAGLAEERAGALKIVKVHAVENAATAARYAVRAMPTVLLSCGGVVRSRLVGVRPKSAFVDLLGQA